MGFDLLGWFMESLKITYEEALHLGTLVICNGFIYPVSEPWDLTLREDSSLYRFQSPYFWQCQLWPADDRDYAIYLVKRSIHKKRELKEYEKEAYNQLHEKINHQWDFIVMQAKEQIRAAKERKKGDRVVMEFQERAYWMVHRPPLGMVNSLEYGVDKVVDPNATQHHSNNPSLQSSIKFSLAATSSVGSPCRMRVERWAFGFGEILSDTRGLQEFQNFLKKEFSAENLAFWEACQELRYGDQAKVKEKAEKINKLYLAQGAKKWINIDGRTMRKTLSGLKCPHRYMLDSAQAHIYMLMKKDSYPRYLKSDLYKNLLVNAAVPQEIKISTLSFVHPKRHSNPSPVVLRTEEETATLMPSPSASEVSGFSSIFSPHMYGGPPPVRPGQSNALTRNPMQND
uniref:regulator of G-protein signaling 9-like n=1 Tax=Myxine glutinosa TaxID=7769 RepID=UPI00359028E7